MTHGPRGLVVSLVVGLGAAGAWASHHEEATTPAAHHEVPKTPAPADAEVYIISPEDGAMLSNPVTVRFGLKGMGVAPAGVPTKHTGHHHLIIDSPTPPAGKPVPADENHIHFGGGQTEVTVELEPGKHTLQLVLADHNHVPHDPPVVSDTITIEVK